MPEATRFDYGRFTEMLATNEIRASHMVDGKGRMMVRSSDEVFLTAGALFKLVTGEDHPNGPFLTVE